MNTNEVLKNFIVNELMMEGQTLVDNHQSLLDGGIIDSLGIMKLTLFIEETFKIKINEDDLTPENFENINKIGELIEKMRVGENS